METISTYSEARNEYLKQLSTWIVPYMINYYRGVWAESLKTGGERRVMVMFQEKCAEVPKWNQDMIDTQVNKLLENCRCDYLEELMSAVFIAHTKVLIAVRINSRQKKLQITLPKLDHFLHRIFSECARAFWKAPFLFLEDAKPIEMQKNILQAEALCNEAIGSAVRSLLPIKNILTEYLSEDMNTGTVEEEEEVKPEPVAAASPEKPAAVEETVATPVSAPVEPIVPKKAEEEESTKAVSYEGGATKEPTIQTELTKEPDTVEPTPAVVNDTPAVEEAKSTEEKKEDAKNDASSGKAEQIAEVAPAQSAATEELVIDTEPAVHFSNYDNVIDENSEQSFKFVPKDSDEAPRLEIKEDDGIPLSADDSVMNLEAPGVSGLLKEDKVEIDEILE